jgi:hypothetical protein
MTAALVIAFVLVGSDGARLPMQLPWQGTMLECQLFGQQLIAHVAAEHPGMKLERGWTCSNGRTKDA